MLGRLKPLPALALFGNAEVGNGSVQPAGGTQTIRALRRQQPVAGAMRGISTEPAQPFRVGERLPVAVARGCERAQDGQFGEISQDVAALLATSVFEVQQLAAVLALEQPHAFRPPARVSSSGISVSWVAALHSAPPQLRAGNAHCENTATARSVLFLQRAFSLAAEMHMSLTVVSSSDDARWPGSHFDRRARARTTTADPARPTGQIVFETGPWIVNQWTPFNALSPEEASSPGYPHTLERQLSRPDLPYGLDVWHGEKVLSILWSDQGHFEVTIFVRGSWGRKGETGVFAPK